MLPSSLEIALPAWLRQELARAAAPEATDEARMAFVLGLVEAGLRRRDGGPFAAAVFDGEAREPLAAAVNLVLSAGTAVAHAELLALALAQQRLGSASLAEAGVRAVLVTSTEPCAMCLGACLWSGIGRVVCSARGEDAEAIGFDEGAKPADLEAALAARGILLRRDVLHQRGQGVLRAYRDAGGPIYGGDGHDPGV
jgi:tRNA(Arg) A34 adenosine deaminase TadA